MIVHVFACDYDGTIAHHGRVAETTAQALARVRESGRKLLLVTGRMLPDLRSVCPDVDEMFDAVVAENGAVLYFPETRESRVLGDRPESGFVIVGYVAMSDKPRTVEEAISRGAIHDLTRYVENLGVSEVVLALEERRNALPLQDLLRIKTAGVHVNDFSSFIERETGREVTLGAVYAALERMERKGLLRSALAQPTGERGGKRRRLFSVTPAGLKVLGETRRAREALWNAVPRALRSRT